MLHAKSQLHLMQVKPFGFPAEPHSGVEVDGGNGRPRKSAVTRSESEPVCDAPSCDPAVCSENALMYVK